MSEDNSHQAAPLPVQQRACADGVAVAVAAAVRDGNEDGAAGGAGAASSRGVGSARAACERAVSGEGGKTRSREERVLIARICQV